MNVVAALFFLALNLFPISARAAGAYLVDDGGIVEKNKLQFENWYSQTTNGEFLAVTNPDYQIFENAEFAMQETYDKRSRIPNGLAQPSQNSLWPQIKYLWHKSESVLSSAVFGINYSTTDQKTYGSYAYIPTTLKLNSFADLHVYLGWQNWRHPQSNNKSTDFLNYGSGLELHYSDKLSFVSEIFQTNGTFRNSASKRPALQLGSRYFYSSSLIFDAIIGRNINGNNKNWLTLGATIIF